MATTHLLDWYNQATTEDIQEGITWYPHAQEVARTIAEKYDLPVETVAKVIAVLSPLTEWDVNVEEAMRVIREWQAGIDPTGTGRGYRSLPANRVKAVAILEGTGDLQGNKVESFYANIMGNLEKVTVDTWAARAWSHPGWVHTVSDKVYWHIAADYREVARQVGMTPAELQAVVWVVIRRMYNKKQITQAQTEYKSQGHRWQDWLN